MKWRFWLAMNSKRGVIGGFISMFFATVVIVFILLLLIVGSGIIKEFVDVKIEVSERGDAGVAVYNETRTGIDNVFGYVAVRYGEMVVARRSGDYSSVFGVRGVGVSGGGNG